jgi:hypothetical protein
VVFIFNLKELGPIMKKVYVKKGMIPETEDEAFAGAVNIKQ